MKFTYSKNTAVFLTSIFIFLLLKINLVLTSFLFAHFFFIWVRKSILLFITKYLQCLDSRKEGVYIYLFHLNFTEDIEATESSF